VTEAALRLKFMKRAGMMRKAVLEVGFAGKTIEMVTSTIILQYKHLIRIGGLVW